jgi:hypothetical protein
MENTLDVCKRLYYVSLDILIAVGLKHLTNNSAYISEVTYVVCRRNGPMKCSRSAGRNPRVPTSSFLRYRVTPSGAVG